MFQPPGFCQHSLVTQLGKIAYYTAEASSWQASAQSQNTLVFLHGLGGGSSAYEWSKVYPAFAADYRVLAPDLVGWGASDHPERNYGVDDYLNTIAEFLQQTCQEPAIVIASSLTAAFTIRVAIAHPELFQSLILIAPTGLSDFGNDYRRSFFAQLVSTPILDRLIYTTAVATSGGIRSFLEQRQFAKANRVYPEIVAAYLESATRPNAEYSALSFVRGDLCFDLATYLPQLTIPTAILWGQQAQFTNVEVGRRLADLNPEAVRWFQPIQDSGLTPHLELPAVTIGLMRQCFERLA
jgi:haloalkane dehalogenase